MEDQETVTLSREQWNEVRRAILYTKRQTRSIERIKMLEEAYEQMVNQGADQATDKHMTEWRKKKDAAAEARREDELKTAQAHESILAGLARERPHSRFFDANGNPVQWSYKGDGAML